MTWYVTRRPDGGIAAAYQYVQPDLELFQLEDGDPELVAFLNPPPPVPHSISRRQCAKRMLMMGLITGDEALEMTRNGTPPAMVSASFDQLSPEDRVLAEIDFAADTYERANPLLVNLMLATGASEDEIDDFFREAAAL